MRLFKSVLIILIDINLTKKIMRKILVLIFVIFGFLSIKSQNLDFPYSQKDYLIKMNEIVKVVEDLYNTYGEDTI